MSNAAINWALQQKPTTSSAKFVLVVLANVARDQPCTSPTSKLWPPMHAYLSVAAISQATQQDRKTVMANLQRLQQEGLLEHAGTDGQTNQVAVYRLCVNGPKSGTGNSPENGTVSEVETVPVFPPNSTEIPAEQYQFSASPVPKTGHEPQSNPIKPKTKPMNTERAAPPPDLVKGSRLSPEWELPPAWRAWATAERPDLDISKVAENFRDYWLGMSGSKALKADWAAAWRYWIRKEGAAPSKQSNRTDQRAGTLAGLTGFTGGTNAKHQPVTIEG